MSALRIRPQRWRTNPSPTSIVAAAGLYASPPSGPPPSTHTPDIDNAKAVRHTVPVPPETELDTLGPCRINQIPLEHALISKPALFERLKFHVHSTGSRRGRSQVSRNHKKRSRSAMWFRQSEANETRERLSTALKGCRRLSMRSGLGVCTAPAAPSPKHTEPDRIMRAEAPSAEKLRTPPIPDRCRG